MSYTALYRKFRPSEFDEVKGQDHIVTTLRNQIQTERIDMLICFVEPEEPARQQLQRS